MEFGGMKPWVFEKAKHTVRFTCKALEDPELSAQTILHLHCVLHESLKILAYASGHLELWNRELVKKFAFYPEQCEEFLSQFGQP